MEPESYERRWRVFAGLRQKEAGLSTGKFEHGPTAGLGLLVLICFQAIALGYVATRLSPTPDEFPHLMAGLSYLHCGRYDLYNVNPPLIKCLAALPVYFGGFAVPPIDLDQRRPEFDVGLRFWELHRSVAERYLVYARWIVMCFALLGTAAVFVLGSQLHSRFAGFFAALLWVTNPLVLAYGALLSFDIPACTFGIVATSALVEWLRRQSAASAGIVGLSVGLAMSVKTTWVILLGVLPAVFAISMFVMYRVALKHEGRRLSFWECLSQSVLMILLAMAVLNLGYRFNGSFTKLGEFSFVSHALSGAPRTTAGELSGNRFHGGWLSEILVPLPAAFVEGVDSQMFDFQRKHPAYRFGEWHDAGCWYFYLLGYANKLPTAVILLAALGAVSRPVRREVVISLLGVPCLVLVLVSAQTNMNIHFRYALIVLGQVLVLAGIGLHSLLALKCFQTPRCGCSATLLLLISIVAAPMTCFPYCHQYANELSGGPTATAERLGGTAADWYQGWWAVRDWLAARNGSAEEQVCVYASRWIIHCFHRSNLTEIKALDESFAQAPISLIISTQDRQQLGTLDPALVCERIAGSVEVYRLMPDRLLSYRSGTIVRLTGTEGSP